MGTYTKKIAGSNAIEKQIEKLSKDINNLFKLSAKYDVDWSNRADLNEFNRALRNTEDSLISLNNTYYKTLSNSVDELVYDIAEFSGKSYISKLLNRILEKNLIVEQNTINYEDYKVFRQQIRHFVSGENLGIIIARYLDYKIFTSSYSTIVSLFIEIQDTYSQSDMHCFAQNLLDNSKLEHLILMLEKESE